MFPHGQAPMQILPKLQNAKNKVCLIAISSSLSDSPIFVDSEPKAKQPQASSLSAASTTKSPSSRGPRTPRKVGAQATRLEAIDDSFGPLGPLGENPNLSEPEVPPAPPSKEQTLPARNARSTPSSQPSMNRGMIDSTDLVDDDRSSTTSRQRYPQGQPAPGGIENSRRPTQPSVSIEQAARPSFDITVGDPHKVGDLTSSHIVYQVRTKVCLNAKATLEGHNSNFDRRPQKHISSPNSQLAGATVISYGSTIRYTIVILESSSLPHLKSKPLVALTATL